jgi:hypothetical protein
MHGQGKTNTTAATAASFARYENQADPDGLLSPEERRRRAEHLRAADMKRKALRSAVVRRERKAARGAA